MNGYGNISWWGFSPSCNLASFLPRFSETPNECNILLINNHDPRNIIHTICSLNSSTDQSFKKTKLNFYVLEPSVEQFGRYMLMLSSVLDENFGLQEKIETFLEIYGNSLLRNTTSEYIMKKSNQFIDVVTDADLCAETCPMFDLSLLKHKERDYLEGTLKFWRSSDNRGFEIHKMWEYRNREHLGPRYDVKENTYDWDRIMKLQERGAAIIGKMEYESFRSKGVAFESRAGDYDVPNKTLSSPVVLTDAKLDRVMKRGYFGDVITGPFIAFGIESKNEKLFEKSNNTYNKASLDVTTYNLQELFKNLEYHHEISTIAEVNEDEEREEILGESATPFCNISVKFVFGKDVKYFTKKQKFSQIFDLVFIGSDAAHLLTDSLLSILKPKCSIVIESPKYVIELKKEQVQSLLKTFIQKGEEMHFQCSEPKDGNVENPFAPNYLLFTR